MDANDRPSTTRAEYRAALPSVELIRDLMGGTPRMHERCATYIVKWRKEKPEAYAKRATAAKVYGGLTRALSASVGMLFAKDPAHEGTWPAALAEHWENIDGKGAAGPVYAKRRAEDALADGFGAILVDFPSVPEGVTVTQATERALNLRPFWAAYARLDILNWRYEVINNRLTLTRATLRESLSRPDGAFGTKTVSVYRVLLLRSLPPLEPGGAIIYVALWQLLEEVADQSGAVAEVRVLDTGIFRDANGAPFDELPLAIGYGGRTDAPLTAAPPLLDLAWANLQHWRIATDKRWYEQLCAYPQPLLKGQLASAGTGPAVDGKPVAPSFEAGPGVLVTVKADGDFLWRELQGTSLERLQEALQVERDEMGELGASFLAKKTRAAETAEAKRIDSVAENATLATAAQGIEDWLNDALRLHARYLGIPAARAPTLVVNKDFDAMTMDAATMTAYVGAVRDAGLPVRILLDAWQQGGRIAADTDLDALAFEMEAAASAEADRKAEEAADRLAMAQERGGPTNARPPLDKAA